MTAAPMTVFMMGPRAYEKDQSRQRFRIALAQAIASGLTKAKERAQEPTGKRAEHGAALMLAAGWTVTMPRPLIRRNCHTPGDLTAEEYRCKLTPRVARSRLRCAMRLNITLRRKWAKPPKLKP
jgi:hypothetical protein